MNIVTHIKMMQAARNLNDSQTAALIGTTKQNYSRKLKNQTFSIDDLQQLSSALGFEMKIVFTDKENGWRFEVNEESI